MSFARAKHVVLLAAALAGAAPAQPPSLQPEGGRGCVICHLPWAEAFKRPQAVTLVDRPPEEMVSQSETCLGCHDGSVGDDREHVFTGHGHQVGITPPAGMKIPRELPLANGKLACRTCHTAHSGQPGETLANTVFLRMRNEQSQLCQSCHPQQMKGPELGSHPVGGMPWPVPEPLVKAGAKTGPDPFRLICQTCHTPHGSSENYLLVMGTESSQLCLTCHEKVRPGLWRPDVGREHPQNPPLSPEQVAAIEAMGTRAGADNTLICLSCHKLHHGLAGRYMLADTLHDSDLCVNCHPGRKTMFGTVHDLRQAAPEERNRLGQTPEQSGPCGACHSFHQFARRPNPTPLDPTGLCATCHSQGAVAAEASGLPFSHPIEVQRKDPEGGIDLTLYADPQDPEKRSLACLTCHDPHETANPHFLRHQPSSTCTECHRDYAAMAPAHDFSKRPELKNARGDSGAQTGKCGFCHGVHNALGPALWVATKNPPATFNGLCTECHRPEGLAAAVIPAELRHPAGPETARAAGALETKLPLFDGKGHPSATGAIACGTCHDPHGTGKPEQMLRVGDAPGTAGLCGQCHTEEVKSLPNSLHSDKLLAEIGDTQFCLPCHAAHARPGMPATGMWAGPVGLASEGDPKCSGCHAPGGKATMIVPTPHPVVGMQTAQSQGGGHLPLEELKGTGAGVITCNTCHLPHGRTLKGAQQLSIEQLRSLRPMLRSYQAPNLCSTCHGADGLRRFLYYHDPSRRGGPFNEGEP